MLFWAIASILAQLVSTFNLNVTEFYTLKAQKAVFSNSTVLFIMSVVVIAAASAAINARSVCTEFHCFSFIMTQKSQPKAPLK